MKKVTIRTEVDGQVYERTYTMHPDHTIGTVRANLDDMKREAYTKLTGLER